VVEVVEHVSK
jgi:nitrite reductase/ring-hydroxylating ferredoxin subunit